MTQYKNNFIQTVKNTWAEKGTAWLEKLPDRIKKLSDYWRLTDIQDVPNMSYNYVAFALQDESKQVVLKISCDHAIFEDEYRALRYFKGYGSVKLLDINEHYHALLLERIMPGTLLKKVKLLDTNSVIKNYAEVVNAIASAPASNRNHFTHVRHWCNVLDRIKDTRIETRYVNKAKEMSDFLLNSSQQEYVCHGDLHLENIIQHGAHWISIDPKGIIGEKAFEASAFDLLSDSELKLQNEITVIARHRIKSLSTVLVVPYERLLLWFYVRCVISAQWFIEDNGDPSKMIRLIEILYQLIYNL